MPGKGVRLSARSARHAVHRSQFGPRRGLRRLPLRRRRGDAGGGDLGQRRLRPACGRSRDHGRAFAIARERGVAVGAHPGYPDLWASAAGCCPSPPARSSGWSPTRSAPRPASRPMRATGSPTSRRTGRSPTSRRWSGRWRTPSRRRSKAVDPSLSLLAIALTAQVAAGEAQGLDVHQEIFADRGYTEAGFLIPRGQPGAMITDEAEASERVLAMVQEGAIIAASGGACRRRSARSASTAIPPTPSPPRAPCAPGSKAPACASPRSGPDRRCRSPRKAPASSMPARPPWSPSSAPPSIRRSTTGCWPSTTRCAPRRRRACARRCRPTAR